jgi:serine/threonine-protein kinase RsbW
MVPYLLSNQTEIMLRLSSDPRSVSRVETFVERIAQKYKIAPDIYGNILISLTEAVNNAIIHGNGNDMSKTVEVKLTEEDLDSIAFQVRDEGRGFDYNNLPDPTSPENLTRIGGRGVFLMHQLSDRVDFQDNGSTVEMRFSLNEQR